MASELTNEQGEQGEPTFLAGGGSVCSSEIDCLTEPSADRGPRRGSPLEWWMRRMLESSSVLSRLHTTRGRSATARVNWMNFSAGPRIVYHFS